MKKETENKIRQQNMKMENFRRELEKKKKRRRN
jgi:hypothetical protein